MRTVRLFVAGLFAMLIGPAACAAACAGFSDVDSANSTYCPAVTYLKDKGITLGCTGTTYCPNAYVTRLQMALFLQRFGRGDSSNVLDVNTDTIGGGVGNTTQGGYSVVSGGEFNSATANYSVVSGGFDNTASGERSSILGGEYNSASGENSLVIGGTGNVASGRWSVAAGKYANADHDYCMLLDFWGTTNSMSCLGAGNIVRIGDLHGLTVDYYSQRPDGGGTRWLAIGDQFAGQTITAWNGAILTDAGVWVPGSSSKVTKTEFVEVDAQDVLDKVAKMPITTWRYKQGEGDVRHIGPMAEDFWESFGVGYGPQTIADIDARGVALAAIQGLNAKVQELMARIAILEAHRAQFRE